MSLKVKYFLVFLSVGIIFTGSFFFLSKKEILPTNFKQKVLSARASVEYTQKLVQEKKPEPTISALAYAYAATAYYETLKASGDEDIAEHAARYISEKIMLATSTIAQDDVSVTFLKSLLMRIENDGHLKPVPPYSAPKGDWVWVDRDNNPKTPFTPLSGSWKRWNTEKISFQVPPPPQYKSKEYLKALDVVRVASENRTAEQSAAINFWGGVPGTVQPAGIWLDQFFSISEKYKLSNEEYAYTQMVLAQTLSDAFMECWKVKYTYWTKRPDMEAKSITTAMPNPPFPGYVSGHSTISFAAATVLAKMFPEDAKMYLDNAEEAKNSRLWAGIHFPYDNEEGKKLGIKIGESVVKKLQLHPLK